MLGKATQITAFSQALTEPAPRQEYGGSGPTRTRQGSGVPVGREKCGRVTGALPALQCPYCRRPAIPSGGLDVCHCPQGDAYQWKLPPTMPHGGHWLPKPIPLRRPMARMSLGGANGRYWRQSRRIARQPGIWRVTTRKDIGVGKL